MAAKLLASHPVDGPEGVTVRILFYDDGSIRIRVNRSNYAIEEAFLTGNRDQHAIVKLAPRRAPVTAEGIAMVPFVPGAAPKSGG
jgi:hypothetical protein